MTNSYTKRFNAGQALTESQLNTAFRSLKPSLSNLTQISTSTTHLPLRSTGSSETPVFSSFNDIINNTVELTNGAQKIINAHTSISSTVANLISNARTRAVSSTASTGNIAYDSAASSIQITTAADRPVLIQVIGILSVSNNEVTGGPPLRYNVYGNTVEAITTISRNGSELRSNNISIKSNAWSGTESDTQRISFGSSSRLVSLEDAYNLIVLDIPGAGTHTYTVTFETPAGNSTDPSFTGALLAYNL